MTETTQQDGVRPQTYAAASKWLHWIIAACVLAILPMGIVMPRLPEGALQNELFDLHRSTGILVLALAVLRVSARYAFSTPAPARSLTRFERIASVAAHHSLLLLIFLMPLVGWASMSAYRAEVSVLSWAHTILGYSMAAILVAHIGGALMHGFIRRDGVLNRMLPERLAIPTD